MPRLTTTFGRTWWSQRWLRPLDELDAVFDGRLSRGRALARDGGVLQIRVEPGVILATVKGSYWERYDTAIEVPALAESVWARVIDELTRDTLAEATLLAGEMPTGIEAAFARVGARLFAESDELIAECACADGYRPCKHILATMYAMAARLDQEPLLLFQLRGKSSAALLSALRRQWADEEDIAFPRRMTRPLDCAPTATSARFRCWTTSPSVTRSRWRTPPSCGALGSQRSRVRVRMWPPRLRRSIRRSLATRSKPSRNSATRGIRANLVRSRRTTPPYQMSPSVRRLWLCRRPKRGNRLHDRPGNVTTVRSGAP